MQCEHFQWIFPPNVWLLSDQTLDGERYIEVTN